MKPPSEFLRYTEFFDQEVVHHYPSEPERLRAAAEALSPHEAEVVKGYFDALTIGRYTSDELREVWNASRSEWYIIEGDMIAGFKFMRSFFD